MLDIKFIRENADLVAAAARKKHINFNVDELLDVEKKRLALLAEVEKMRAKQNEASKTVVRIERQPAKIRLVDEMKTLKAGLQQKEEELAAVMKNWQRLMLQVPNVPDVSVPEGESEAANVELRRWGEEPKFNFPPKNHVTLLAAAGLADLERGTKISGFRGYVLTGGAVGLTFALWRYALDYCVNHGFTPMMVPSLVRPETLLGTGFLPQGAPDLYVTQDKSYLSGTAEVSVMGYWADEVFSRPALPKKVIAFSPCFRREAGAHGQDTKGLVRVHEFYKWEMVILCEANHETSVRFHEELTGHAEAIVQGLGLPYRVVANCGADLGLGQVKKYDLEVWLPAEARYRETHSASYFHDFQTRRLNIRYRDTDGKLRFAHSLNNTALATPRLLAALAENYQQADGTIRVPEALVNYVGTSFLGPSPDPS